MAAKFPLLDYPPIPVGLIGAAVIGSAFLLCSQPTAQKISTTLIPVMGGIYCGFALKARSNFAAFQEAVGAFIFSYITKIVMDKMYLENNPSYIGIGIILHGCYDLLHHFELLPISHHVPKPYGLTCASFDIPFGLFFYWYWSK